MSICENCGQFISDKREHRHQKRCQKTRNMKEVKKMVKTSRKGGFKLVKKGDKTFAVPMSSRRIELISDNTAKMNQVQLGKKFTLGQIQFDPPLLQDIPKKKEDLEKLVWENNEFNSSHQET